MRCSQVDAAKTVRSQVSKRGLKSEQIIRRGSAFSGISTVIEIQIRATRWLPTLLDKKLFTLLKEPLYLDEFYCFELRCRWFDIAIAGPRLA